MKEDEWYRRFGAIPGLSYETPQGVKLPELPSRFLTPSVNMFEWDGRTHRSLAWQTDDGTTSASPAHRWRNDADIRDESPENILRNVHEALELPGLASDYHFALLGAYEALASRARDVPDLLADVERLCLLDLMLVETLPAILRFGDDQQHVVNVPAYRRLIALYERNGFLDDALAIARRAAASGQGGNDVECLEERIADLRAEDES